MTLKNRKKKNGEKMEIKKNNSYKDTIYLALGEMVTSLVIVLVYLALGYFDWTVITGVVLGSVVTVLNFVMLSHSVNKALNKYLDLRGNEKMDDEEAEKFAKANSLKVQNAITKSYILRTFIMMGSLVLALITGFFDPLATLIPLIMYKPLLYVSEFIKRKRGE